MRWYRKRMKELKCWKYSVVMDDIIKFAKHKNQRKKPLNKLNSQIQGWFCFLSSLLKMMQMLLCYLHCRLEDVWVKIHPEYFTIRFWTNCGIPSFLSFHTSKMKKMTSPSLVFPSTLWPIICTKNKVHEACYR